MTMKMTLKMKNKSHRYDIIRPKPRHGHKYTKYKMCLSIIMVLYVLKVHYCRFENLPISSFSYKNNMLKISRKKTFYFLRHVHVRYVKSLFTNIQKKLNMLKFSLLFKKFTNVTVKYFESS